MIGWLLNFFAGLGLRAKLYGSLILTGLVVLLTLWLRLKVASRRAVTAEQKAEKLEQTRKLEQRIAQARAKTRERQDKLREQIKARASGRNDYFER